MATTLDDINDIAGHPHFIRRTQAAIVKSAISIGNEATDPANPQRSTSRHALAINVLNDPQAYSTRFAYALAANAARTLDSADGDLEWTVASVWDALAGIAPAQ